MTNNSNVLYELTPYEKMQIGEIRQWKAKEPGVVNKLAGTALNPLTKILQKAIPEVLIAEFLGFSQSVAKTFVDSSDIEIYAGIRDIKELRGRNLKLSDDLADKVHKRAVALAAAEGAGTGVLGLPGLLIDIPSLITLALRTIHKIGMCYGYEGTDENDKIFILSILSISSANSTAEKSEALRVVRSIHNTLADEALYIMLRQLGERLSVNLAKRKALAAIPLVGAVVDGSVNGWYINDVAWTARRSFQERWLIDSGKVNSSKFSVQKAENLIHKVEVKTNISDTNVNETGMDDANINEISTDATDTSEININETSTSKADTSRTNTGKVRILDYKGKKISFVDFSGCSKASEVYTIINEFNVLIQSINPPLLLVNVERMDFNPEIIKVFNAFADQKRNHIKALAVLGISGFQKIIFKTATGSLRIHIDAYPSSQQLSALEWLSKF